MANVIINARAANNNFIAAGSDANGTIYREPKPQEALPIAWTDIQKGGADAYFIQPTKDHKTIVLMKSAEASDAKTVTFKAGNSYAAGDYTETLAAGAEKFVAIESAKFADKYTGLIEVETNDTTASKIYLSVLEVR